MTIAIRKPSLGSAATAFLAKPHKLSGYKQPGWGREMGKEVTEHHTETKAIAAKL